MKPARCAGLAAALFALGWVSAASAHPAPFSYINLEVGSDTIDGTLSVHVFDVAHDLGVTPAAVLDVSRADSSPIVSLFPPRVSLVVDGHERGLEWDREVDALLDRQVLTLRFRAASDRPPGTIQLRVAMFPYDTNHQTFVNVYERATLVYQTILTNNRRTLEYFSGTRQGVLAVVRRFVPTGVHHIIVGPDHILFLVGLLLFGGGAVRLLKIVTAFTIAHSLTLSAAVLDLVNPPARLIEPAIALSIVYVGADNLLATKGARDMRTWIALVFGLVHGFGFASVLRETGLAAGAVGWSLLSFNLGVEIGQIGIVTMIALLLGALRERNEHWERRIMVAGSLGVVGGGSYWFIERVFFTGGV